MNHQEEIDWAILRDREDRRLRAAAPESRAGDNKMKTSIFTHRPKGFLHRNQGSYFTPRKGRSRRPVSDSVF